MGLSTVYTAGEIGAAAVVFPVVGSILIVVRTRIRLRKSKSLGIEDWLVFPALAFLTGMGITTIYGIAKNSVGYRTLQKEGAVQMDRLKTFELVSWNTRWMHPLALGCTKLSFIFFYRRIFNVGTNNAIFNVVSLASLVLIDVWMLGFFLGVLLICPGHIDTYWNEFMSADEYCWNYGSQQIFRYILYGSDVVTDVIVLSLPVPSVLRLHMTFRKKIAVIGVFSLGALTLAASIVRAVFSTQVLFAESYFPDGLGLIELANESFYWMLVETGLALIAVNLPLLYGNYKREGLEKVIRKGRSLASIRLHGSDFTKFFAASFTRKTSDESYNHRNNIELVRVGQSSKSVTTQRKAIDPRNMEDGKINVIT